MNVKNDAGYGRCPQCGHRLRSVTGSSDLVCFNCVGSDAPKTGHTIIIQENTTKHPAEDPTAKITVVQKDGTQVEQPTPVATVTTDQPGDKCITISLTLEELETDYFMGTLLKKTYEALDELPAGTVKETKRVIRIQDRIDQQTGSYK